MAKYPDLGRIEAVYNKLGGKEGVDRFLAGELIVVEKMTMLAPSKPKKKLLEFISTVSVLVMNEPFLAKGKFVVNTSQGSPVKISYIGDNFATWFLAGDGKVESPTAERELVACRLRKGSVDSPIIAELGNETETTLAAIFSLMEKQGKGEDGVLLSNGYANIFYVKDDSGVLRAVRVYWDDGGWFVGATSVESPYGWGAGSQVFSRNSVL